MDYQHIYAKHAERFGAEFALRVEREHWTRVPECTGIWWQILPEAA